MLSGGLAEDVVVPGDYLAVSEEYLPGPGTYEFDYKVRAAIVGKVFRDRVSKIIMVKSFKTHPLPQPGSVVIAVVTEIREDYARGRLFAVNNTTIPYQFTGILHVTQVAERVSEARHMYDYLRIGDIIRAKVLNHSPPYLLTMREPRLGVILASCSQCGAILKLEGEKLVCPHCGHTEKRKLGYGYGHI